MGFFDFLKRFFFGADEDPRAAARAALEAEQRREAEARGRAAAEARGAERGVEALAVRLGTRAEALRGLEPRYRSFALKKRRGGKRTIAAPVPELKALQRRILRRLLARLPAHPAARGFERGQSIVTNALPHVGKAVVVVLDLRDFFLSTRAERVGAFFRRIGWSAEASDLLVRLCTRDGALPQGAPTSPRLSTLVNYRLDARLAGIAARAGAVYTRYADDLTFSFEADRPGAIHDLVRLARLAAREEGYEVHRGRKLHIRRRHDRQLVTGIVVNERAALPRTTRRWLRAVEFRAANGGTPTLSPAELAGWRSLASMVARQAGHAP